MLLIDALYVHNSGGKKLLEYLIFNLENENKKYFILFDDRIDLSFCTFLTSNKFQILNASEKVRKSFYYNISNEFTSIFCFSNVPPPIIIYKIPVYVYFHNTLLVSDFWSKNGYNIFNKIIFLAKRYYIKFFNKNWYTWIVQTELVRELLSKKLGTRNNKILVIPFFVIETNLDNKNLYSNSPRFLYVADGVKQKNHINLLKAFEILFLNGYNPGLALTIPAHFKSLNKLILNFQEKGINIVNYGTLNGEDLKIIYANSEFFIFPSLTESFGLPLLEASMHGCKVISSDLPFVFQIIMPSKTFNPYNINSIASAIQESITTTNLNSTVIIIKNQIIKLIKTINHE